MTSPVTAAGPDREAGNLLNGIAADASAGVTNLAITTSGTMLKNGLESSNVHPACFHEPQPNTAYAALCPFIFGRYLPHRVGLLRMTVLWMRAS